MTRRRGSITVRLALGLSLMTGALWIGAAAISATVMQHAVNEAHDYAMRQTADRLLPLAIHDIREPREQRRPRFDDDGDEAIASYIVRARDGQVILSDGNAPEAMLAEISGDGFHDTPEGRVYAQTDRRSGLSIVLLEAPGERTNAIHGGVLALIGPLAALLPLVAAGVWFALRLALRPLEKLRQDIAARDRHNLAPTESEGHPRELAPIAEEVASLLSRLQSALDAERAFSASSAHELRTPIAGALAQTQVLAAELRDSPAAPRIAEIERALRRLSTLSERLLQFARLEAGFARTDEETDLLPVVQLVVRDFVSAGEDVHLEKPPADKLLARINPDAFALAFRNLIDNALKHGDGAGEVRVRVGPGATLSVTNDGALVPPDLLAQLGRPFVRGQTTAAGTGLGLSIVRAVMDQTGGSLTLASPAPGHEGGFEARLVLAQ